MRDHDVRIQKTFRGRCSMSAEDQQHQSGAVRGAKKERSGNGALRRDQYMWPVRGEAVGDNGGTSKWDQKGNN